MSSSARGQPEGVVGKVGLGSSSISSAGLAKAAAGSPNKTHQHKLGSSFSYQIIFSAQASCRSRSRAPQPSWGPSLPFLSLLPRLCCSNTSLISLPFTSRCLELLGEPWLMQEEQQWGVNEHRKLNVFVLFVLL